MTTSTSPAGGGHWSVDLLAEFFTAVSLPADEEAALQVAVERASEQLDCEFAAVTVDGVVGAAIGLGRRGAELELPDVVGHHALVLPGLGPVDALAAPLTSARMADTSVAGRLTLGRVEGAFSPVEEQAVRAMATVVGLVLRNLRMLRVEKGRQQLLRELLEVQRSIARRRPLQEVLDAVIAATSTLLEGASAALVLADEEHAPLRVVARSVGTVGEEDLLADPEVSLRAAQLSVERGVLVAPGEAAGRLGATDTATDVVSVPVQVHGAGAGALVAWKPGWRDRWHHSSDMLSLFAQQVSLALTDADTVRRMNRAMHDSLTGLPERALFRDRLDHALAVAARRDEPLSLMFLDLDGFKLVNDTWGHAVGDAVLVEAAARITGELRESDTAGRLGGDEFAVLLEAVEPAEALVSARRIVEAVGRPMTVAGHRVGVGVSIGVAGRCGRLGTVDDLLSAADAAMYSAKRAGRGRVVLDGDEALVDSASSAGRRFGEPARD